MYTRGVTLDPQPVSLETLAQFSSLIIEAAHWLEREGKTLWNPLELTPKALLERYRLDELFLATLEGEAVGTVVLRNTDPLELAQIELPAGGQVTLPASSYVHIRQVIWVQQGQLTILEGAENQILSAGDCLGFGPPSDVTLANETTTSCTYLVVLARG